MGWVYFATPVVAYVVAGATKFVVNCIRARRLAFDLIGLGGLPSTHASIVSSAAGIVAIRDGIDSGAFCVAIAVVMIVVIDAMDLRRKVGRHAGLINQLMEQTTGEKPVLRERMGHSPLEILAGLLVGTLVSLGLGAL